jgi:hypothetical protein
LFCRAINKNPAMSERSQDWPFLASMSRRCRELEVLAPVRAGERRLRRRLNSQHSRSRQKQSVAVQPNSCHQKAGHSVLQGARQSNELPMPANGNRPV